VIFITGAVTFPASLYYVVMRFIPLVLLTVPLLAQKPAKQDTVFCDCPQARIVTINGNAKVNKTIPPPGHGEKKEISEHQQRTHFAFEKEHHSAWYKLVINTSGHLCFTIIPTKKDDDYDFMLFPAYRNGFCDSLQRHRLKPVRACISRDKEEVEGKTGMGYKGKKELVKEGIGDAYVKPLYVTKGEIYYLVLDNVYEKGEGHSIQFYFEEQVKFKGVIVDEKNRPIQAEIALTNPAGDTIRTAMSNRDGEYEFEANMRKSQNYVLNFYNDSSFTFSKTVTLKDSQTFKNIRTILPKLRKGIKYSIGAINFYGGSPQYIPGAIPSINNLYKLMSKNKSLSIQIEGHTNGCEAGVQRLSEERAAKIKDYLVARGTSDTRIKTLGKGCKEMLFPLDETTTEEQQEKNRRVEVLVLEY
jgi:outer membrane protein OmpA-like peptidoglycan-associated protein